MLNKPVNDAETFTVKSVVVMLTVRGTRSDPRLEALILQASYDAN